MDDNDLRIPCGLQKILKAVFDQDPQPAVCVSFKVAAKWSMVKDETVKDLLGQRQQSSDSLNADMMVTVLSHPTIHYLQVALGQGLDGHTEV